MGRLHAPLPSGRCAVVSRTLLAGMRMAALDLGSNSFYLLVADVHVDGTFTAVAREKEMLRLGDDVARHGRIPPASVEPAVEAGPRLANLPGGLRAAEAHLKATAR